MVVPFSFGSDLGAPPASEIFGVSTGHTMCILPRLCAETRPAPAYELRGSDDDSGLFFTKTLPAGSTSYADEIGPNQAGDFIYELKACDAKGCSSPSTVVVRL